MKAFRFVEKFVFALRSFGLERDGGELQFKRINRVDSLYHGLSLQRRDASVEDEDGFDFVEQQFAQPVEQAEQMCVGQGAALRILEALDHLMQPNGDVWGNKWRTED